MTSLKRRLSLGLGLALSLLLILQWALVTYAIDRLIEQQIIERLKTETDNLIASTQFDLNNNLSLNPLLLSAVYQRPFSGHYYVVKTDQQQHISRSLWDNDLDINPLLPGDAFTHHIVGPQGQSLFVLSQGYLKQGQRITVAIAEDLSSFEKGKQQFKLFYTLLSAIGLVILLIVQWRTVHQALKPLRAVQTNMAQLRKGETEKIDVRGPDEIRPMILELNRLLDSMGQRTKRSRASLGNLAHALKTRLTLLNQTAESSEIHQYPEIKSAIYDSTGAIGNIIERELKRARLVGAPLPGKQIDLELEIAQLAKTLMLIYRDKNLQITWDITTDANFFGEHEDLLEMLGNLLDNACKWCETQVHISVRSDHGILFSVEDDGEGCDLKNLHVLTQRGFRADETIPGSGLGLAIVHDIVKSYDGDLAFQPSDRLGGLHVLARLKRYT